MKFTMIHKVVTGEDAGMTALFPSYESDADSVKKLKINHHYRVDVRRPRNLKHHNKFIALLRLVLDNDAKNRWVGVDQLLLAVKMELGLVEFIRQLDGTLTVAARSINFESMDQDEFRETVYEPALEILAQSIGATVEDIENNLMRYM